MRHRVAGKKLGRNVGQRNALRRTMITQFLTHERIKTTRAKAQAIRGEAESMITQAKRSIATGNPAYGIHVRRLLAGRLDSKEVVTKIFDVLAPRYAERPGGYTRMYLLGPRKGDAAEMVILELVDRSTGDEDAGTTTGTGARRGLLGRFRRNRPAEGGEASGS